jgi:hypothetical protein
MTNLYTATPTMVDNFNSKFMIKKYANIEVSMLTYSSGDVYIGQQIKEEKIGLGTMYYENGDVYIGNWLNNVKDGCGVFIEKTGTKYVGKWRKNKLHWRKNQIQYENGNFYEGDIRNGEISGEGTMIYKNDPTATYTGGWLNSKWHGNGTLKYADGEIYQGEFQKNERCGQGKCIWPSGLEYEGGWDNDNLNGEGVLDSRKINNKIQFGPWIQGTQQQSGYTMNII